MTKQERKYLRSIYHHFDKRVIRHTNTPDTKELAAEWKDYKTLLQTVFLVLCLEGCEDGQSKEDLEEIIKINNIKIL